MTNFAKKKYNTRYDTLFQRRAWQPLDPPRRRSLRPVMYMDGMACREHGMAVVHECSLLYRGDVPDVSLEHDIPLAETGSGKEYPSQM